LLDVAEAIRVPVLLTVVSLSRTIGDAFGEGGKIGNVPYGRIPRSPFGRIQRRDVGSGDERKYFPAFNLGENPTAEENHKGEKDEELLHCG
jgi:hypothetical protein